MSALPPGGEPDDTEWVPVENAATGTPDPDPDEVPTVTLAEMLAASRATYRQLDYWVRQGWLHPDVAHDQSGAGYARQWTPVERDVASLMVRLIESGILTAVAARIATDAVRHQVSSFSTEWGVTISWRPIRPTERPQP